MANNSNSTERHTNEKGKRFALQRYVKINFEAQDGVAPAGGVTSANRNFMFL